MTVLHKIFGDPNVKLLKSFNPLVAQVNGKEPEYKKLSDDQLKAKTAEFKATLKDTKTTLDQLLPDAFAVVREAARRQLGQRHYDVQIMAGIALHQGNIAEMKTGEGKTLSATLPVYLNALTGQGCHLVTVNDYLSRRDCGWMGPIYHALGLSIGVISHSAAFIYDPEFNDDQVSDEKLIHLKPVPRKEAYAADITYGTNNEFGFDYLRDNMVQQPEQKVQRGLNYAIVDEVDSILIDEARTPLIISAPDNESTDKYHTFGQMVKKLESDTDYNIDEKMRAATLTEDGVAKMEKMLGVENIYTERGISEVHHIEQALRAHALYSRDKDYVVNEGEVIIIDEFTGRMLPGRRYSEGLHQAIEAKEGVEVQRESRTLATITFQNYFRLFEKLAGMTGTAATEAEEFIKIYGLEVAIIPTNKPLIRDDRSDRIYIDEKAKFNAVVKEVKQRNETGQPILIGTISIEKNEKLGELLSREGIPVNMLNAKQHEKEASIISQAGERGAVTVATNMAGRGVDIKLGGEEATKQQEEEVRQLGGLHVIGTERHESRRIDNQLRGRSGRQGDAGSTQFYVSMDDDLMRIFGSEKMKNMMKKLNVPEDVPIENKLVSRSLETAQKKIEGHNFDTRKHLVEYDDVLNRQRDTVYRKRYEALTGKNVKDQLIDMIKEEIDGVVNFHTAGDEENLWDIEEIYEVANTIFSLPPGARLKLNEIKDQAGSDNKDKGSREKLSGYLLKLAVEEYNKLAEAVNPTVGGEGGMERVGRSILLRSIDTLWIEYLETLQHLRTGIGLRGYGQRDPLVEYQKEAFQLFKNLMSEIRKQVVYSLYKVGTAQQMAPSALQQMAQQATLSGAAKTMSTGPSAVMQSGAGTMPTPTPTPQQQQTDARQADDQKLQENAQTHFEGKKVGRNDDCPCGSGKKFKKCHGA